MIRWHFVKTGLNAEHLFFSLSLFPYLIRS